MEAKGKIYFSISNSLNKKLQKCFTKLSLLVTILNKMYTFIVILDSFSDLLNTIYTNLTGMTVRKMIN